MSKYLVILFIGAVLLTMAVSGCQQDNPIVGLPNPASVYCEEKGGTLEIRETSAGQYGVCVFDDGSECDEWAFYRGECAPGQTAHVPEPGAAPAYVNTAYAFSFNPDSGYSLEERDHQVLFLRDGYSLVIGFRTSEELIEPLEPVAVEGSYSEAGVVSVLGVQVPKQNLVNVDKVKLVIYSPFQAGDLQIYTRLWVESKDQNSVDIPASIQDWADSVIETFALSPVMTVPVLILKGTSGTPDESGWITYTMAAYGFSFRYPAEWSVDDSIVNSINLTQDGCMLHIGYRRPGEDIPLLGTGTPGGEVVTRTPVIVLEEPHDSQLLVAAGNTIAALYESAISPHVEVGFRGDLFGTQASNISADTLAQFDQIVMSLTLLPK